MTHLPKGDEKRYICPYTVERARTGLAKCRTYGCWKLVPTGTLRIGQEETNTSLRDEYYSVPYYHLGCVTRKITEDMQTKLGSIAAAEGFGTLSESDQALVLGVFTNDKAARAAVKEEQRVAMEKADAARDKRKAAQKRSTQRWEERAAAAARGDDEKPAKKAKKAAKE